MTEEERDNYSEGSADLDRCLQGLKQRVEMLEDQLARRKVRDARTTSS